MNNKIQNKYFIAVKALIKTFLVVELCLGAYLLGTFTSSLLIVHAQEEVAINEPVATPESAPMPTATLVDIEVSPILLSTSPEPTFSTSLAPVASVDAGPSSIASPIIASQVPIASTDPSIAPSLDPSSSPVPSGSVILPSPSASPLMCTLRVCKIIKQSGAALADWSALPPATFSVELGQNPQVILGSGERAVTYGTPFATVNWSTTQQPNATVAGLPAVCTEGFTIPVFPPQNTHITYREETITSAAPWFAPLYNDGGVGTIADFFPYDGILFDGDPTNDVGRSIPSDGDIQLTQTRCNRTLAIVNETIPPGTSPAPSSSLNPSPSGSTTPSLNPSPSGSSEPSVLPSIVPSGSPDISPSPSDVPSPSLDVSPSPQSSTNPTPSASIDPTPLPSGSQNPSPTADPSSSPAAAPSPSASASSSPSVNSASSGTPSVDTNNKKNSVDSLAFTGISDYLYIQSIYPLTPPLPIVSKKYVPSKILNLTIYALDINLPVVTGKIQNGVWDVYSTGVSHWEESSLPNMRGNIVLYGHNWDTLLGRLKEVHLGDEIDLDLANGERIRYIVSYVEEVEPSNIGILSKTDYETLTLYTCTGPSDSLRLVVHARPKVSEYQ